MKSFNIKEFIEKSRIVSGRCKDCGGFLFIEFIQQQPIIIQQRCLRCGKTEDITKKILGDIDKKNVLYKYDSGDLIPIALEYELNNTNKIEKILNDIPTETGKLKKSFFEEYEEMLVNTHDR